MPILKFAHRFQIEVKKPRFQILYKKSLQRAMDLAETYLIHSKRVTNAEKMFLAEKYGLESLMVCDCAINIFIIYYLQAHCFDNIKTLQEIKRIEVILSYRRRKQKHFLDRQRILQVPC